MHFLSREVSRGGRKAYEGNLGAQPKIIRLRPGERAMEPGEPLSSLFTLISGQAFSFEDNSTGRRQIYRFFMEGELLNPLLQGPSVGLEALTPCVIEVMPRATALKLILEDASLNRAYLDCLNQHSLLQRAAMLRLGQMPGAQRLAHLFCEIVERSRQLVLMSGNRLAFAVTQTQIADALGLSDVHVNRCVSAVRQATGLEVRRRSLLVPDWPGLVAYAGFDPAYLGSGTAGASPPRRQSTRPQLTGL